jgi:DNA-binding response OmpR family regulator
MSTQTKGLIVLPQAAVFVTPDPDSCSEIANALEKKGFEINYVKDGTRAINLSELKPNHWKPAIFFIDLVIPGDSGFFVTKIVNDKYSETKIPIILFAAHIAPEDRMEASQIGALGLLQKPLSYKDVEELLEKERVRRQKADIGAMGFKIESSDV